MGTIKPESVIQNPYFTRLFLRYFSSNCAILHPNASQCVWLAISFDDLGEFGLVKLCSERTTEQSDCAITDTIPTNSLSNFYAIVDEQRGFYHLRRDRLRGHSG